MTTQYDDAIRRIDAVNGEDPSAVSCPEGMRPGELVYSERMTSVLLKYCPTASEELKIAARAQHIARWKVPRASYPMDRRGYHLWRNDLKKKHAEWAGEIMSACGYGPEKIIRTQAIIRKENLKTNPEAQTLEDVACLVFLSYYADDFSQKHDDQKMVGILAKTWTKMSTEAQKAALGLALSPRLAALVTEATRTVPQERNPE